MALFTAVPAGVPYNNNNNDNIYNVIGSARLFWHGDQSTHAVVTIHAHIILLYCMTTQNGIHTQKYK